MKDPVGWQTSMGEGQRVHNFGAGPAVLPLSVVEEVQAALPNMNNSGFGLCEISHRSAAFQSVVDSAMDRIRRVLSVPDDYTILFLQGGASLQFYTSALNLLKSDEKADFLETGGWSKKSLKEANRIGDGMAIWSDSENGFKSVPNNGDYNLRDDSVYLHYTSNNTGRSNFSSHQCHCLHSTTKKETHPNDSTSMFIKPGTSGYPFLLNWLNFFLRSSGG